MKKVLCILMILTFALTTGCGVSKNRKGNGIKDVGNILEIKGNYKAVVKLDGRADLTFLLTIIPNTNIANTLIDMKRDNFAFHPDEEKLFLGKGLAPADITKVKEAFKDVVRLTYSTDCIGSSCENGILFCSDTKEISRWDMKYCFHVADELKGGTSFDGAVLFKMVSTENYDEGLFSVTVTATAASAIKTLEF